MRWWRVRRGNVPGQGDGLTPHMAEEVGNMMMPSATGSSTAVKMLDCIWLPPPDQQPLLTNSDNYIAR